MNILPGLILSLRRPAETLSALIKRLGRAIERYDETNEPIDEFNSPWGHLTRAVKMGARGRGDGVANPDDGEKATHQPAGIR